MDVSQPNSDPPVDMLMGYQPQRGAKLPRRTSSLMKSPRRSTVTSLFGFGRSSHSTAPIPSSDATPRPAVARPTTVRDRDDQENIRHRYTPDHFKNYELMTEFINLRNPSHCPLGIYVMPATDNLHVWYGVVFVHKGYYRSGVFKFRMNIPDDYPASTPTVTFLTDMFHPLVDVQGELSLTQQFPTWRPYKDYLFHVLHYIKNIFKRSVLDGLVDKYCYNKEAYRLYRTDSIVFGRLAQQCAQLSITESYLFDHFPDDNMIRFTPLSEAKFNELKTEILHHAVYPPPEPDDQPESPSL